MDPFIDGSAEAVILRKLYHVYPWIFRRNKRTAAISGTIIHKYNLKITDSLSFKTGKNTIQICHSVKVWYDY